MAGAASLIILRNAEAPEVFWVQRRKTDRFLAGFHAFPGGKIDDDDLRLAQGDPSKAARIAALREAFEETGPAALSIGEARALEDDVVDAMIPAGQWSSPPYLGTSFDTYYFVIWDDSAAPEVRDSNPELEDGAWIRPQDALDAWERSEVLLAPPTHGLLKALAKGAGQNPARFYDEIGARGEPILWSQIRPDITLFPLRTPTLPPATHTNTYLVGNGEFLLVEPASPYADEKDQLEAHIEARQAKGDRLRGIFLTHHHHDHIGAVGYFSERYNVPIMAHPETAKRVPFDVDELFHQGDSIHLDGGPILDVHFTPGHAPGHLCLVHRGSKTAIVGDMVAGRGSILVEPVDGNMAQYLESLAHLRRLGLTCLLPSHGPGIGGPKEKLSEYIDHRLHREQLVTDALEDGLSTLEDLLSVVYADVPAFLRSGPGGGLAGASLKAHLIKLCAEGRAIQCDVESWKVGPTSS